MTWKEFCESQFGVSADWINRLCTGKAEGPAQADADEKEQAGTNLKPFKLDARQQVALARAQVAANELVGVLKNGSDWQAPLAEYEKVAVTSDRLEACLSAVEREPNRKAILATLVNALETCGDTLPFVVRDALRTTQDLLGRSTNGLRQPWCAPDSPNHLILTRNIITEVTRGVPFSPGNKLARS